jgi:DNA adenine methylase
MAIRRRGVRKRIKPEEKEKSLMRKVKLIRYFGGKVSMIKDIAPYLEAPHSHYVEVFGGGAGILLNKKPSPCETYNDIDNMVVNLFRVVRDPKKFKKFQRLVMLTPYSRTEWIRYCDACKKEPDEIHRAFQFYYAMNTSFSGRLAAGFSTSVGTTSKHMAGVVASYLTAVENLEWIHQRLFRCQIENQDWRIILDRFDTPGTLFYLDPPYVPSTRRSGEYLCEIPRKDHRELVRILLRIKGKAILSGYDNPIYKRLERNGWKTIEFSKHCLASAYGKTRSTRGKVKAMDMFTTNRRTEKLWLSPNLAPGRSRIIGEFLNAEEK